MACFQCGFFQASTTWLALLLFPIFAVLFPLFSSSTLLFSISLSLLLILFSTLFILKQKPNMSHEKQQENTETTLTTTSSDFSTKQDFVIGSPDLYSEDENLDQRSTISSEEEEEEHFSDIEFSSQDQNHQPNLENTETTLISSSEVPVTVKSDTIEQKNEGFLTRSRDSYSESESLDHCSTTSSEEDHSSDIEWPYNMGQRLDCSDDSISDEESLIEIAIPSGQFVYPADKDYDDPKFNLKCCKLSADIYEMNEEDNLIEIDIYMGSIKCSRF